MKTKNILLLIVTIGLVFLNQEVDAKGIAVNAEGSGLHITSQLTYNETQVSDYSVIIYDENQSTDTIAVTDEFFHVKLGYGHIYALRFIKPGYMEKIVMIDARINPTYQDQEANFEFEIEMISLVGENNILDDLPVAVVKYNSTDKEFEYSRDYHRQVRNKEIVEKETVEIGE